MIGCLPIFNSNQLTDALQIVILTPNGIEPTSLSKGLLGLGLFIITSIVVIGGLTRIANMTAMMVSIMVVTYFIAILGLLIVFADQLPYYFSLIFRDAFGGSIL